MKAWLYPSGTGSILGSVLEKINNLRFEVTDSPENISSAGGACLIIWVEKAAAAGEYIRAVRRAKHLALAPLIIVSPEIEPPSCAGLADAWLTYPLPVISLQTALSRLADLSRQIETLSPPPDNLTSQETLWVNILRYVYLRRMGYLTPVRHIDSAWGFTFPLIAGLADTDAGEELDCLRQLEECGFLEGKLYDRIHLCPKCRHYQLNFREVCPECQSVDIVPYVWLHHFRCSHMAPKDEFFRQESLVCPKCHRKLQHVGVDYDYPRQDFRCAACRQEFSDPEVNCTCINCGMQIDSEQIVRQDVRQYCLSQTGIQAARQGFLHQGDFSSRQFLADLILSDTRKEKVAGIMPYQTFKDFLKLQLDIAGRFNRPMVITGLRTVNGKHNGHARGLLELLGKNLRCNDIITCPQKGQFLILSTETDLVKAELALNRIKEIIRQQQLLLNIESAALELSGDRLAFDLADLIKDLDSKYKLLV